MQNLNETLTLAEQIAGELGFKVVDVRLSQDGKRRSLEVTICRKGGRVSLTDCEEVSRKLDKALDEQETPLIDGAYVLNVQSPGLDRQLKTEREFEIFEGEQVEIQTKEVVPPLGAVFEGKLLSKKSGVLSIEHPKPIKAAGGKGKKKKATETTEAFPQTIEIDEQKVALVRLHPGEPDKSTATTL